MVFNSYILLYYYHNLGSLRKHLLIHLIISVGHLSEFSFTEFSVFRISYKAIQLLSRAQASSEMSAREEPIWKVTWLLAGISSLLAVRLSILFPCWMSAGSCPQFFTICAFPQSISQHGSLLHKSQQGKEFASEMHIRILYNPSMGIMSYDLCHNLLVRSKSQVHPTWKGSGYTSV